LKKDNGERGRETGEIGEDISESGLHQVYYVLWGSDWFDIPWTKKPVQRLVPGTSETPYPEK